MSDEWFRFLQLVEDENISDLTTVEVSDTLGVSQNTIRGWVRKGWVDTKRVKNTTGRGKWRWRTIIVMG